MSNPLPDHEVDSALKELPAWTREQNMIVRRFEFTDFSDAMVFVNKVAEAAEEANHHPNIYISWNKVRLELTSHDSGGITQRDLRMARRIDSIAG
jgi:4a-hydroxytetrahydrobiopterin dehydratase